MISDDVETTSSKPQRVKVTFSLSLKLLDVEELVFVRVEEETLVLLVGVSAV